MANSDPGRRQTMEWAFGVGVIVGMVLLRLMVPVVVTLAVAHALRRLEARWRLEGAGENNSRDPQGPGHFQALRG